MGDRQEPWSSGHIKGDNNNAVWSRWAVWGESRVEDCEMNTCLRLLFLLNIQVSEHSRLLYICGFNWSWFCSLVNSWRYFGVLKVRWQSGGWYCHLAGGDPGGC